MFNFSRRMFLGASAATVALLPSRAAAASERSRLILLGTMGGPVPSDSRQMTSQVILAGADAYLIDCGPGTIRQLAAANIALHDLRAIFVTHNHDDHVGDYCSLVMLAWANGLRQSIDVYGPPPLKRMTELCFEMYADDIAARQAEFPRMDPRTLVNVHEIMHAGPVFKDTKASVRAATVDHGAIKPAFAYRFELADRTIAFSGDTRPTRSLVQIAEGADILVQEAMYWPATERQLAHLPNGAQLGKTLRSIHTTAEDCGCIAEQAHVKVLVLSHLVPGNDPTLKDAAWIEAAARHFHGPIIVGRDLLEL